MSYPDPTYSPCCDDLISEDGRCNTCSLKVEVEKEDEEFEIADYLSEDE